MGWCEGTHGGEGWECERAPGGQGGVKIPAGLGGGEGGSSLMAETVRVEAKRTSRRVLASS